MSITDRIQHAWNAFRSDSVKTQDFTEYGYSTGTPTHRQRKYTDSAFAASIFNRIAMDVSMTSIQHVKIDEETEDAVIVKLSKNINGPRQTPPQLCPLMKQTE